MSKPILIIKNVERGILTTVDCGRAINDSRRTIYFNAYRADGSRYGGDWTLECLKGFGFPEHKLQMDDKTASDLIRCVYEVSNYTGPTKEEVEEVLARGREQWLRLQEKLANKEKAQ